MSVAARRPRLCEQPAAGAFPLVIGSLRFDLTVVRKPPACRADERPLMWAPVGRVTAAPLWRGAISGGARHGSRRLTPDLRPGSGRPALGSTPRALPGPPPPLLTHMQRRPLTTVSLSAFAMEGGQGAHQPLEDEPGLHDLAAEVDALLT